MLVTLRLAMIMVCNQFFRSLESLFDSRRVSGLAKRPKKCILPAAEFGRRAIA